MTYRFDHANTKIGFKTNLVLTYLPEQYGKLDGDVNFKKMHFKLLLVHILHASLIITIIILIALMFIF